VEESNPAFGGKAGPKSRRLPLAWKERGVFVAGMPQKGRTWNKLTCRDPCDARSSNKRGAKRYRERVINLPKEGLAESQLMGRKKKNGNAGQKEV